MYDIKLNVQRYVKKEIITAMANISIIRQDFSNII